MSIEASWDLHTNLSPRSLAVFHASDPGQGTNPFDTAADTTDNIKHAISCLFGSERGSLHFRSYTSPSRSARSGLVQSMNSTSISSKSEVQSSTLQLPLGISKKSSGRAAAISRSYFPIDLKPGSFPGPVVACLHINKKKQSSVFLVLVDDNRGSTSSQPGTYTSFLVTMSNGSFHVIQNDPKYTLPRMSCSTYHPKAGLVYASGRNIAFLSADAWDDEVKRGARYSNRKPILFDHNILPAPGARSGQDALAVTAGGKVVVVAVGNSFYAVAGQETDDRASFATTSGECIKVLSCTQSSQVHPVVALDVEDASLDADWSCLFLASGRECAVVDVLYGPPTAPRLSCSKPRNGNVTVASPILAAAATWPWLVVLTSDGLVSIRSPACLAIPLRTVEVGQRPNDYFVLRTLKDKSQSTPWIIAVSYSGESKVLQCQPDTAQDLADRLMRHAIDAFGANGFPRSELAEAVNASFTATSYVGPEPSVHSRLLLKQYLEAVLGLVDFESGASSGWPIELADSDAHHGSFGNQNKGMYSGRGAPATVVSSSTPAALVAGTSLLCLVCSQVSPPDASLASRASKACAEKIGVIFEFDGDLPAAAISLCDMVAEKLLREASSKLSLVRSSSPGPIPRVNRASQQSVYNDLIEAAVWLFRSSGKHERAIEVAFDRLQCQGTLDSGNTGRGAWSIIKYESYTATHLSELWAYGKDKGAALVLKSSATHRLLEDNPRLGISVFTAMHPQNETQWRAMSSRDDPLVRSESVYEVVKLLKSVKPAVPYDRDRPTSGDDSLPLESGRALAVTFLESAIGINTGRPTEGDEFDALPGDAEFEEHLSNFHDELSFLLLEGVISERRDDDKAGNDSPLGKIYRKKLRDFLNWPLAKIRSDKFMDALPQSFFQEKALVLGRLGRHEDALRILFSELGNLELALEYCDDRHKRQKLQQERNRTRHQQSGMFADKMEAPIDEDNAYLPLLRVALESSDTERGTASAIQVLALRRNAIDRAAALRLLPSDVPVAAVARPFLIPALVDSESQVRRLTVVSALLRARYLRLKDELTAVQLKAQANLNVVPQLRSLNLGDPLHTTKPFRARTNTTASATMPDVVITKYFFPRHLVIQAKVTNSTGLSDKEGRTLSDVAFVVAESSEEAIQPLLQVPVRVLPIGMSGSAWCVLSANPARMDGPTAQLTCEFRYTVQSVDAALNAFGGPSPSVLGRTYVEELQDLEVHAAYFS